MTAGRAWILLVNEASISVTADGITVGRSRVCDAQLTGNRISRVHARFRATDAGVVVDDMASRHGIYARGERVQQSVLLQDGDRVTVGSFELSVYALFTHRFRGSEESGIHSIER